jgi:hypothetical protein
MPVGLIRIADPRMQKLPRSTDRAQSFWLQVQKELVGPYQLIRSGVIDFEASTMTMPLYRGTVVGFSAVFLHSTSLAVSVAES